MCRHGRHSGCLATLGLLLLLVVLQSSSSAAETRICLNMIAKNEANEILECLGPLAPELSGWTLCDTGSTDGTVEVVEQFFKKQSIPGIAATHSWQDFGHNRNMCIKEGMDFSLEEAKRQGMAEGSHYCDYLLFLDADQILRRPADIQPGSLKAMDLKGDGYHMTEKGVGVTYKNLRLVSTRLDWEWVGEVHEFVHRKDDKHHSQEDIDGVWFHHDASGGQGGKRFVRDEQLLRKAVEQRPEDTRARFYFANTLRALHKDEEAIKHYIERIRLGGWDEERFMSGLNIADLAKIQWEKGELISPQVAAAVGNWDSHVLKIPSEGEQAEEERIQAARKALEAAKDAAQARLDAAGQEAGTNTKKGTDKAASTENDAGKKGSAGTTEQEEEQQEQLRQEGEAPEEGSEKRHKVYSKEVETDAAVQQAAKYLQTMVDNRKRGQFPLLVSAYLATAAILPYRPEPWVHLAKLYRLEKGDTQKCFNYASAALAQGNARQEALFLNTNHANYEALDEMCACAYYVDHAIEEGRAACRKLEQVLTRDLLVHPDSTYLTNMLGRTKGNLGWYARKAPQKALPGECPADAQHICAAPAKPAQSTSPDADILSEF